MEHQWQDIKTAYNHILNHAFKDEIKKDEAHGVVLRILGTTVDLLFSGDAILNEAMSAVTGETSTPRSNSSARSTSTRSTRTRAESDRNRRTSALPPQPQPPQQPPQIPNLSNLSNLPGMENLGNIFSELGGIGLGMGTTSEGVLNNEEIRQLFSFWPMFDNANSTANTTSTTTPPRDETNQTHQPDPRNLSRSSPTTSSEEENHPSQEENLD